MGCAGSSPGHVVDEPEVYKHAVAEPEVARPNLLAARSATPALASKSRGTGKGKGKGKGMSKGMGKGKGKGKGTCGTASKFQIELEGKWENYGKEEDAILRRAYLVGHPHAKYHLRGQDYEYNFKTMKQINLGTCKERRIRPPRFMRPPQAPLLPPGSIVVVTVPEGAAGGTMKINDPNNAGEKLEVSVPAGAKTGAKMAVPVPKKGETAADVRKRQEGYSTGAVVAMGAAAAGAGVVGGAILGDHLTGGEVGAAASEWAEGAYSDAADWVTGAAADVGAWAEGAAEDTRAWAEGAAEDAGEWVPRAVEDAAEWTEGAAEDAGEWVAGAAEDIGDWLGEATEDAGDFVMDLF